MVDDCVFCKIAQGRLSAKKIYEDDDFLGFLDTAPLNKGHVQLIPKKHYRWVWDVPNFGEYWTVARIVAKGQMKGLGASMVEFLTHGMEVNHAHIWIVPVYKDEAFIKTEIRKKFDDEEMEKTAMMIRESI